MEIEQNLSDWQAATKTLYVLSENTGKHTYYTGRWLHFSYKKQIQGYFDSVIKNGKSYTLSTQDMFLSM